MSKLETNTIDTVSGTSTLQVGSTNTSTITLGVSGDTINVPSGVTIANSGTATGFGANTPAFSVYNSAQQTIGSGTDTDVIYNTELFDTDNAFASNTFTVPSGKAGFYFITALFVLETSITSRFWMNLKVNGNVGLGGYGEAAGLNAYRSASVSMIKSLSAGDAVKAQVQQQSGSNAVSYPGQNAVFMAGYKLI